MQLAFQAMEHHACLSSHRRERRGEGMAEQTLMNATLPGEGKNPLCAVCFDDDSANLSDKEPSCYSYRKKFSL
jgi:hypothetical protein